MTEPVRSSASAASDLDRLLTRLAGRKEAWVSTATAERIALVRRCIEALLGVAEEWVHKGSRNKGIDPRSVLSGEEWLSGPVTTIRGLRLLAGSLAENGAPAPPGLRTAANGQRVARVFPPDLADRLLFPGVSAEVWIEPGRPASQGRIYREEQQGSRGHGRVALVLGAGNVSSIAPLDALHKLLVDNQVVLLKLNPVNDYLCPTFRRAFAPLIEAGFLELATGGADVGEYLCRHPLIDTIHLTGSARTHDAIVWGADPELQAARKAQGRRSIEKPVTSELGCVTPILVVPGRWSRRELDFQARNVAGMIGHNASFNCNAGKVLVLSRGWEQRAAFLERLEAALAAIPPRRAYYPGAHERYREFCERYPQARVLGAAASGAVPWTLIPDVSPRRGEYALTREAFCGVLAEVSLECAGAADFLERAVELANESIRGSLSCMLLIAPRTARSNREALDLAIDRLRYGTIAINTWAGLAFGLGVTSWGAYPGQTAKDVGSGTGFVHNTFLFDYPQKSVLRAPFVSRLKPPWFADHRTLDRLGRALAEFEVQRSPGSLARVAWAGLRG